MSFLLRTIIPLLIVSLNMPAQRQGLNMQYVANFQQTVANFDDFSNNNLGIYGVAMDGEWMYLNAQIQFEGTGIGTRLIVAKMEAPWNIAYETDRIGEVFDWPGFARRYDNSLYMTNRRNGTIYKYNAAAISSPPEVTGAENIIADLVKTGGYVYTVSSISRTAWPATLAVIRDDPSMPFVNVAVLDGYGLLNGVSSDGSYLFVSSDSIGVDSSGIRIFDISQNPEAPQEVITLSTPGIPQYLAYDNDNLYIASGDSGLVIVDVTNRDQPQILTHTTDLGTLNKMEKRGDLIYSLGTETDDLGSEHYIRVIDVRDVNQPLEVGYHLLGSEPLDMSVEDSLIAIVHDNDVSLYRYVPESEAVLSFGSVPIKQDCQFPALLYQSDTLLLHNTGSADLIISNILTSDSSITVDATSFTIKPGAEGLLTVYFHHLGDSDSPDFLVFEHNGSASPDTLRLHGCDYPPGLGLWTGLPGPYIGLDFGMLTVGDVIQVEEVPSVNNFGNEYATDVLIGTVVSEHPDLVIENLNTTDSSLSFIVGRGYHDYKMTFSPEAPGDYSMRLRFDHNAGHEPRYVTYTATVVEAPLEYPLPPTDFTAYSDFTTPTEIALSWSDPATRANGDSLTEFEIVIERDDVLLDTIAAGIESYSDQGLTDGQNYSYTIWVVEATDSTSDAVSTQWIAGGAATPASPDSLVCIVEENIAKISWRDPQTQIDGTPADDVDSIYVFRNDNLIAILAAGIESYNDTTAVTATHSYYLQAKDNEVPSNLSELSDTISCFVGPLTDILVWSPPEIIGVDAASADSIVVALQAHGKSVSLTRELFEASDDLSIYEAIFVVLGYYEQAYTFINNDTDALALGDYLSTGGNLYIECGQCFDRNGTSEHDILPWFGLLTAFSMPAQTAISGQNDLSGFEFDYAHVDHYVDGFTPNTGTEIWRQGPYNAAGVFAESYGFGRAIGVVVPFGSMQGNGSNTQLNIMRSYLDLFAGAGLPRIAVGTDSISASALYEQSATDTIQIRNVGVLQSQPDLSYSIDISPTVDWVSLSSDSGNISPGEKMDIALSFDASGLVADLYTTSLMIASNDSMHPQVSVPVEFTVLDGGTIAFSADSLTVVLESEDSTDIAFEMSNSSTLYDLTWSISLFGTSDTSNASHSLSNWLVLTGDSSGVILPGESESVGLRFYKIFSDTTLEGYLEVSSSDQSNLQQTIPVFLTIIGSSTAIKINDQAPSRFALGNNYPNPFNPQTTIEYKVASVADVQLAIYNNLGQLVRVLVEEPATPGTYRVNWDGRDSFGREASSGIYFYQLTTDNFRATRKMMLMR